MILVEFLHHELRKPKYPSTKRDYFVGILCGSCNKGRGYSAIFNKCITCSGWSGLWIMALSKLQFD